MLIDAIISVLSPITLLVPGFVLLKAFKVRTDGLAETVSFSYLFSILFILTPLYVAGLLGLFVVVSYGVWIAVLLCAGFVLVRSLKGRKLAKIKPSIGILRGPISNWLVTICVCSVLTLLSAYVIYLPVKGLLDSDVVQYYLPIAREIVTTGSFTYGTGCDYNIFIKPIAISVLYSWIYIGTGSLFSESFRLLPVIPMLVNAFLVYRIALVATKSKNIAYIATTIFCILPLHDRFLLYNSYYADTIYLPLALLVIYLFLKTVQRAQIEVQQFLYMGIAIGLGSLLKAQAVFLFSALLASTCLLIFKRKLGLILSLSALFAPIIAIVVTNGLKAWSFDFRLFQYYPLESLFIFVPILSIGVVIFLYCQNSHVSKYPLVRMLKAVSFSLVAIMFVGGLWYLGSLVRFGAILNTSSVKLGNFEWARTLLESSMPTDVMVTNPALPILQYLTFMFIHPSIAGFVLLLPLMLGLVAMKDRHLPELRALLYFGFAVVVAIFLESYNTYIHGYPMYVNPRDLYPLSAFFSTFAALGIYDMVSKREKSSIIAFLIIPFLGVVELAHSVTLYFYRSTGFSTHISSLIKIIGLNLETTSFQIASQNHLLFMEEKWPTILCFSLLVGAPIVLIGSLKHFLKGRRLKIKIRVRGKNLVFPHQRHVKNMMFMTMTLLMCSIVLLPRLEVISNGGGTWDFEEHQLQMYYRNVYELIKNPQNFLTSNRSILTYKSPMGLPYYIPDRKIIDLRYPANLAYLRDVFTRSEGEVQVAMLNQQGIEYLFLNTHAHLKELDEKLNSSIGKIVNNPALANQIGIFGSWTLYKLGGYQILKNETLLSFNKENWSIYHSPEDFQFTISSEYVYLEITPRSNNDRLDVNEAGLPKYNLCDFDYFILEAKGSRNARFCVRLLFSDGTSYDFPHWAEIPSSGLLAFSLGAFYRNTLRGDICISIKSADNLNAYITIRRIVLVEIASKP